MEEKPVDLRQMLYIILSLGLLALGSGCSPGSTHSSDYSSGEISVDYDIYLPSFNAYYSRAEDNPSQTAEVRAWFSVEHNGSRDPFGIFDQDDVVDLQLTGGDSAWADDSVTLLQFQDFDSTDAYRALYSTAYATGFDFVIHFQRDDGSDLSSSVTIPELLDITMPTVDQVFDASSDNINVSWTGTGTSNTSRYVLEAHGSCIIPFLQNLAAGTTSLTISAGSLERSVNGASSCFVTIKVQASYEGTVSSSLKAGSSIHAHVMALRRITISGL